MRGWRQRKGGGEGDEGVGGAELGWSLIEWIQIVQGLGGVWAGWELEWTARLGCGISYLSILVFVNELKPCQTTRPDQLATRKRGLDQRGVI